MKDIDFDELDKAVNSLMSSSQSSVDSEKSVSDTKDTSNTVNSFATSRRSIVTESNSIPTEKPAINVSPQASRVTAPAVRRTGRFMDVVDSSADLNPIRQPIVSPPRDVNRKAVQQLSPNPEQFTAATEAPFKSVDPSPSLISADVVPTRSAPVDETAGESVRVRRIEKDGIMPDPLDLLQDTSTASEPVINQELSDDTRPAAAFGIVSAPVASDMESTLATSSSVESISLDPIDGFEAVGERSNKDTLKDTDVKEGTTQDGDSPFLADAKIEKRPLNASPLDTGTVGTLELVDESLEQVQLSPETAPTEPTEEIVSQQPIAVSDVPELSSELVAIEATGRANDEEQVVASTETSPAIDNSKKSADSGASTATASIAQQYKSKESTGDTSHAPIYDTSQYADPVAHPAKKKSGWLWVLSVLILLALGSGGAVALYLTGIIP